MWQWEHAPPRQKNGHLLHQAKLFIIESFLQLHTQMPNTDINVATLSLASPTWDSSLASSAAIRGFDWCLSTVGMWPIPWLSTVFACQWYSPKLPQGLKRVITVHIWKLVMKIKNKLLCYSKVCSHALKLAWSWSSHCKYLIQVKENNNKFQLDC